MLARISSLPSFSTTWIAFCVGWQKYGQKVTNVFGCSLEANTKPFLRNHHPSHSRNYAHSNVCLFCPPHQIMRYPSSCWYRRRSRANKCRWLMMEMQPNLSTKQHDDQLVKDYGIKLAVQMIRRLRSEGGIQGFHFCTLNLEKSVQRVLETLRWAGVTPPVHNKLIQVREVSRYSSVT